MNIENSRSRAPRARRAIEYFDIPLLTPISSSERSFKICHLPNGILALLVSDPTESLASCALSVATGSHNDPDKIPGLAHLCEHVIVSGGSKRYPDTGFYHDSVAQNGGSHNAFTTGEQTTFYFELPSMGNTRQLIFDQVLDVFASSFKAPLFSDSSISKEIHAIDGEHNANKASMNKILYQATRHLANSSHPFSRFCTGNIMTLIDMPVLNKLNLRTSLVEYFRAHYVAHKMTISLRGPQSLNSLAKLAMAHFSGIPERSHQKSRPALCNLTSKPFHSFRILKDVWLPKYDKFGAFSHNSHNSVIIQSLKAPALRFIFPIEHTSTRFSQKEIDVLSVFWRELFGDEGLGSFGMYLKERGLITSMLSSISNFSTGNDGLILQLNMTRSGWTKATEIISLFYNDFIPSISQSQTEELAGYLSELNTSDLLAFLYKDLEKSSMEMCATLTSRLLSDIDSLGPSSLLKGTPMIECNDVNSAIGGYHESPGSRMWWIGQAIKFQNFVSEFTNTQNVKLILFGDIPKFPLENLSQSQAESDLHYEFDYYEAKIDISGLKSVVLEGGQCPFFIRDRNAFMPSAGQKLAAIKHALQISAMRSQEAPLSLLSQSDSLQAGPKLVGKNQCYEMWWKEECSDLSFKSRTIVTFELISTQLEVSTLSTMHLEILNQLLYDSLSATLYPSEMIGYTYELFASSRGDVRLGFTMAGFPEGVYTMITLFVDELIRLSGPAVIPQAMFRKARVMVREKYEDASAADCTTLASLGLLIVLEKCMWPLEERLEALEDIDMNSFKSFCAEFLKGSKYLNLFIQGDVSYGDKISSLLNARLTGHLKNNKPVGILREPITKKLEPGTNAVICHTGYIDDPNNSIVYFIQTGDRDDSRTCFLSSFTEFLVSLTLVPELRTRKQIGYVVLGGLRILSDTIGIHITCMSSSSATFLEVMIDDYLRYLEDCVLGTLTNEQFQLQYVQKYLELIKTGQLGKISKTSGPANLMSHIAANVHSSNLSDVGRTMKSHKRIQNDISYRRYNFESEEEPAGLSLVSNLTLSSYMNFFCTKISVRSPQRSKLCVKVCSSMGANEILNKRLFMQMESFLKMKGFSIPSPELAKIVEKSDRKSSVLFKELFQYFSLRGKSLKLCSTVIKEILRLVCANVKVNGIKITNSSRSTDDQDRNGRLGQNVPVLELSDPNYFRN